MVYLFETASLTKNYNGLIVFQSTCRCFLADKFNSCTLLYMPSFWYACIHAVQRVYEMYLAWGQIYIFGEES